MAETGRRVWLPFVALLEANVQELSAHLRRFWPLWLAFVVIVVAAGVGLHTGLSRLLERWVYPYNHSYLVLPLAGWLLLQAARRTPIAHIGPSRLGLAAVLCVVLAYAVCETLDVSLGMHLLLPIAALAVIAALAGLEFARVALLPVAFLYFTIPVWDLTVGTLQRVSLAMVTFGLDIHGPPVFTEGNLITIPSGAFEVAEGCSGMRYFVVSLTLAAFFGLNWYERWRTRLLLLAVAGLAALVSNWVRIYTLILIGDATDMQHYVIAKSHDGYGWLVYVVCLAPVLVFASWLERREQHRPRPPIATPPAVASAPAFLVAGVLVALLVASPALLRAGDSPRLEAEVNLLPQGVPGWSPAPASPTWNPQFEAPYFATREGLVSSATGVQVDVFVARYLTQRPGSKLIATSNDAGRGWRRLESRFIEVEVGDTLRRVHDVRIVAAGERRVLWQWYLVGGEPAHSRSQAKLRELAAFVRGRRDGGIVALTARCTSSCEGAEQALRELLHVAGQRLEAVAAGAADNPEGGSRP